MRQRLTTSRSRVRRTMPLQMSIRYGDPTGSGPGPSGLGLRWLIPHEHRARYLTFKVGLASAYVLQAPDSGRAEMRFFATLRNWTFPFSIRRRYETNERPVDLNHLAVMFPRGTPALRCLAVHNHGWFPDVPYEVAPHPSLYRVLFPDIHPRPPPALHRSLSSSRRSLSR